MSEKNPWTTLSTREMYRNPWMRVREDKVIRPDGQGGIYGVVEARAATGVVALTPEGHVQLVGQYRYPTEKYSWEIVQGGADPGEEPLAAAQRELQEEAGLRAATWQALGGEVHLSNCISAERGYLYLAQDLEEVDAAPEGTEILQLKTMPLAEAAARARRGEMPDAMTVIGLLLAEAWWNEGR